MALYTNIADVAAELGGVTIDGASTPSATVVNHWISEASEEIEELTGRVWAKESVTSTNYEYHDYQGDGRIRLLHYPVVTVDSLEYESEGLGASSTAWSTLTEGRTSSANFILYKDIGIIQIHSTANGKTPTAGQQNIRVTYTYGYKTTPPLIKRLCSLLVAKRFIQSVANKSASEEGGSVSVGTISVSDPSSYIHNHLESINREIDRLLNDVVTKFKPHIYDYTLYD